MSNSIPEPSFIERDQTASLQRMVADWEVQTGQSLSEMDLFYIAFQVVANEQLVKSCEVQNAGLQNLLEYATFPMLDALGVLKGVTRLNDETDSRFRERIKTAWNMTAAGKSLGTYLSWSKSISNDILDVGFHSPLNSGVAKLYILHSEHWTKQQLAAEKFLADADKTKIDSVNLEVIIEELLESVRHTCQTTKERPGTDKVEVYLPEKVEYELEVEITALKSAPPDINALEDILKSAAERYTEKRSNYLGGGVIRSQIIQELKFPGVYKVDVKKPVADIELSFNQFPVCSTIKVTVEELKDV